MDRSDMRNWLRRFGHHRPVGLRGFQVAKASPDSLRRMVISAQQSLGLVVDGFAGPKTIEAMSRPRCGCHDHRRQGSARMPEFHPECQLEIGVFADFSGLRGNIKPGKAKELWYESFKALEAVVNVKFHWVGRILDARIQAHVGRAEPGVLAWMEVFDGCGDQHASRYNQSVNWTEDLFYSTALHENAHGLGVGHSPGSVRSIMGPVSDPSIPAVVDEWLLAQLEPRYGLVSTDPVNPTDPTDPPTTEPPGVPGMTFAEIIALLLPIILDCIEGGLADPDIEAAFRQPSCRQVRRLRIVIKRKLKREEPGLHRRERRGRVDGLLDSILVRGRELDGKDARFVIDSARNQARTVVVVAVH